MLQLTRRSFLKSIATLAASLAVPVEVTTAIDYLMEQPELPITRESPSAYIILNGLKLPIANAGYRKERGFVEVYFSPSRDKPGFYESSGRRSHFNPSEWIINIDAFDLRGADFVQRLSGEPVVFSLVPYNSNLRIEGEGYISPIYTEDILVSAREEGALDMYSFEIVTNKEPELIMEGRYD